MSGRYFTLRRLDSAASKEAHIGSVDICKGYAELVQADLRTRRPRSLTESKAYRVDAVAEICGRVVALAGENVTEVPIAGGAAHLGAHRAHRPIFDLDNGIPSQRCEEGRPAAVGVEFGVGGEQLCPTATAHIGTGGLS